MFDKRMINLVFEARARLWISFQKCDMALLYLC